MKTFDPVLPEVERVAKLIVDAAFQVHKELGPDLLESVYESCLAYELDCRGIKVERQIALPLVYKGRRLDASLRKDGIKRLVL